MNSARVTTEGECDHRFLSQTSSKVGDDFMHILRDCLRKMVALQSFDRQWIITVGDRPDARLVLVVLALPAAAIGLAIGIMSLFEKLHGTRELTSLLQPRRERRSALQPALPTPTQSSNVPWQLALNSKEPPLHTASPAA